MGSSSTSQQKLGMALDRVASVSFEQQHFDQFVIESKSGLEPPNNPSYY